MYDKCESCKKWISDSSDCKLFSNDGVKIHTYCKDCYEQRLKRNSI